MGKRLVQTKRGGLAVVDALPSPEDFGDADSIMHGSLLVRRANNDIWKTWTFVRQRIEGGFRLTEADIPDGGITESQRSRSKLAHVGDDVVWVNVADLWESSDAHNKTEFIVLNMDCGPAGFKGEVTLTPTECADDQINLGIARMAEPWEVLAATLTPEPEPPAWSRGLTVAATLHEFGTDPCVSPQIREAATWPN